MTYPGGKGGAGVYQTIVNLMPPHDVYIEPFLGGGAILRSKRPARVNIGVDLDGRVIADWRAGAILFGDPLPPNPAMAAGPAESSDGGPRPPSSFSMRVATIAGNGDRARRGPVPDPSAEIGDARGITAPTTGSPPAGKIAGSGEAAEVRFVWGDGVNFLRSYPFTGSELVYCDPPYLRSTRSGRRLYLFEMTDAQHMELLATIVSLPCHVMISGYSSRLYAQRLKRWDSVRFQSMTRGGRPATEWLWFNFPRPLALHDYRFLGSNFRERERIHRKQRRWTARLQRMPQLERQALLAAIASIDGTGGAVLAVLIDGNGGAQQRH